MLHVVTYARLMATATIPSQVCECAEPTPIPSPDFIPAFPWNQRDDEIEFSLCCGACGGAVVCSNADFLLMIANRK